MEVGAFTKPIETDEGLLIVRVAAKAGCSHCADLEAACESASFKSWMAQERFLFCRVKKDTANAYAYIGTAGGTQPKIKEFPFVALIWPRADDARRRAEVAAGKPRRPGMKRRLIALAGLALAAFIVYVALLAGVLLDSLFILSNPAPPSPLVSHAARCRARSGRRPARGRRRLFSTACR